MAYARLCIFIVGKAMSTSTGKKMKVLVVEDSEEYQKIIGRTLSDYTVTLAGSAEDASAILKKDTFDLILVDINLPKKDGYSLISEIQASHDLTEVPLLCLTGRKEITDKVTAFSLGADDYITKPFDPLELRARIDSRFKKTRRKNSKDLTTTVGEIEIDHARHRVTILMDSEKVEVEVTQTEFKILCCLARRPDQVYTRDQLLVAAWGEDARVLERVVDAHVCLLRKKLGPYSKYIKAVTGVGYKLTAVHRKTKAA